MNGGAAPARPIGLACGLRRERPCSLDCSRSRRGATEEFARRTGKECAACHVDPAGGGELTAAGNDFLASLIASGKGGRFLPFTTAFALRPDSSTSSRR